MPSIPAIGVATSARSVVVNMASEPMPESTILDSGEREVVVDAEDLDEPTEKHRDVDHDDEGRNAARRRSAGGCAAIGDVTRLTAAAGLTRDRRRRSCVETQ